MRRTIRELARDESGQAMVLVAIFLTALVAVAGLVADGGMVFAQRRDLQNVADAAAAAAAMQLDENTYRASSGGIVALDITAARSVATAYLAREGGLVYAVTVAPSRIEVDVSRSARTGFLGAFGVRSVEISAHSASEPRHGVFAGSP